ncbi:MULTISPECIES: SGNH/GDSL hydrolase family protein [Prauserella salsuginis group]|uniref:SGNH/GDSL hydrolase family protein n=1 Tax=Prauserella salsuginis TaxID=387889 RepID=A0ABW6G7Q1_9PSEU|nr:MULTISPECIES: SGNH/GDSL hydrolase family protein [Prauserella salsuginis group]MCR3719556.1 Lysophospholipase L1 [Prauserella flava]MCR3735430.1 Lysophospholipase L1 [Prauserella salsuginis]
MSRGEGNRQAVGYRRFVALGDSQTEGLNDGDELHGFRGWADLLADRLAASDPELRYANLAVRGRRAREVRAGQLSAALALSPDLATVMAGVNDLIRPRFDAEAVCGHIEHLIGALAGAGATVVTFAYPDPGRRMTAGRLLTARTREFNARIRDTALRHGAVVVDLSAHPVTSDPRLWSSDRLHLNTLGHTRLAAAVAHALALPGSGTTWTRPLEPRPTPAVWRRAGTELRWAADFVGPWLVRRVRGRSSGDGRQAKRPALTPVDRSSDVAGNAGTDTG